jgi:hypothetical protein
MEWFSKSARNKTQKFTTIEIISMILDMAKLKEYIN